MDPFSIAVGCIALVDAIVKASDRISTLIQSVRDAPHEFFRVSGQLAKLRTMLNFLEAGHDASSAADQLMTHVNFCLEVVAELDSLMQAHDLEGAGARIRWACTGKAAIAGLQGKLDECIRRMELSLGIHTRCVALRLSQP